MVDVDAANKLAGAMTGFSHQQQTDLQLPARDVKGKGGAAVSSGGPNTRATRAMALVLALNCSGQIISFL